MKVRQARLEAGLTLSELASRAEMSASYLTEIEKGRKHPRADKIVNMAEALGKQYDDLVSIHLAPSLTHLEAALTSPLLQKFPFEEFGLELADLVTLLTRAPDQMSALLHAISEIGRIYDMREEHLLRAILRSYQELNDNYFPDLEEAALRISERFGLVNDLPVSAERCVQILTEEYGYTVKRDLVAVDPALRHYRAVSVRGAQPRLLVNSALLPRQLKFLVAREIGHQFLGIKERSFMSPPDRVDSFQQVFNDFRASYLAGALLMPRAAILADLQAFFDERAWQPDFLRDMLKRYDVTPEMLLYRFSELIPQFFGLNLHFLRMQHGEDEQYHLVKQLNMNRLRLPSGGGIDETHCRRWLTVRLLTAPGAAAATAEEPYAGVQMSEFLHSRERYLCMGFSRPLMMASGKRSSVIVGFRVDGDFRNTVRFADDPAIPTQVIHDTCERCPLAPEACAERAAPPVIWERQEQEQVRKAALQRVMDQVGA